VRDRRSHQRSRLRTSSSRPGLSEASD
jgi:hypothetical protein